MPQQAYTANRLNDGRVVYLTGDAAWSEWIDDAAVAEDEPDLEILGAQAVAATAACVVVEPYAINVVSDGKTVVPDRLRERIRAKGPTVHRDHGNQATKPAIRTA
jgi:hypothetical protein